VTTPTSECCFCGRDLKLTFHHLIPRTLHSRKWFKKNFTAEELNLGLMLCRDCHDAIHRFIPEKEMGKDYNTEEKLLAHEKVSTFVAWVAKRGGQHKTSLPRGRRGRR